MKVGLYIDLSCQYRFRSHRSSAKKIPNSGNYIRQCRQGVIDLAENSDLNMI